MRVVGNLTPLIDKKWIGIIGSRNAKLKEYMRALTLGKTLDGVVVSGLAKGVDAGGHIGGLKCSDSTIALLSTASETYPKQNADLYNKVANRGACMHLYRAEANNVSCSSGKSQFEKRLIERSLLNGMLADEMYVVCDAPKITGGTRYATHVCLKAGIPIYKVSSAGEVRNLTPEDVEPISIKWEMELDFKAVFESLGRGKYVEIR